MEDIQVIQAWFLYAAFWTCNYLHAKALTYGKLCSKLGTIIPEQHYFEQNFVKNPNRPLYFSTGIS